MSRYAHNHHNSSQATVPRGRPVTQLEEAHANNSFEHFLTASTLKTIFGTYRNLCDHLHLKPNCIPHFYPKLKAHVNSWKAKPLWKKFDARANQKCYNRGKACPNTRVLIIGAGPCGLRSAIEAQLLGAKVVVVEKRDRMSRNNVLHLWPFVIDDLRTLGAKKFFGKFCAGAIDHISIRQLQCILLKVALLLGVEIHTEVSFERLIEPNPSEKTGWRAEFKPFDHPVNQFEFDVILGADGKRNTLQGFKRKEFRGKLAIAITANFINKRTEAEARVEEISGVAFIFNQKFFKDLYAETGIDLENIVYYKDDTHYFVMTAKKQSLIEKGVIRHDLSDTAKLLAPDNVDREELMNYAREAADFSTNYQMPDLEFAVNHYGQPDVAMFDFTSMYAAENASRVTERHGFRLLSILVGDSLLEPFWPTGSGCARGFLSSMDAAWAIRSWEMATPLQVIAERESIYRLLAQTTPENLNKDCKSYTLDPSTRYPNLNRNVLLPHQVMNLYDTDNVKSIESITTPIQPYTEVPKKRRRRESHVDPDTLLVWIKEQLRDYDGLDVSNITTSFKDGQILCAILHHYRPDLLDYSAVNAEDPAITNQLAFDLLEKELGITPVMTGSEMAVADPPDYLTMVSYLTQIYDTFRCEIPHIKHPKLERKFPLRRSTCVVPSRIFPVRPILITPNSSAKVSEDNSRIYLISKNISHTGSAPSLLTKESRTNLCECTKSVRSSDVILTSSKNNNENPNKKQSIVDIKAGDNTISINTYNQHNRDDMASNITIITTNSDEKKSEIRILFPQCKENLSVNKSKSQDSGLNRQLMMNTEHRSLKSIASARRLRRKCTPESRSLSKSSDNSNLLSLRRGHEKIFNICGDNLIIVPKVKSSILKTSKPSSLSSNILRRKSSIGVISSERKLLSHKSREAIRSKNKSLSNTPPSGERSFCLRQNRVTFRERNVFNRQKPLLVKKTDNDKSNSTPIALKTDTTADSLSRDANDRTTISSMDGSSEIAIHFLREMDQFMEDYSASCQKISETKNCLQVQVIRPKSVKTGPSEVPECLLDSRTSASDKPSEIIVIKNIETRDCISVGVQEVKIFSTANSIKVVPKLISTVTDHQSPYSNNPGTIENTTDRTPKCHKSQKYLDRGKFLSRGKMMNSNFVKETTKFRINDWLVTSNFDSSSESTPCQKDLNAKEVLPKGKASKIVEKESEITENKLFGNGVPWMRDVDDRPKIKVLSTKNPSKESMGSVVKLADLLKNEEISSNKLTDATPWELYDGRTREKSDMDKFSTIDETEETDLPEVKKPETVLKIRTYDPHRVEAQPVNRPSSRHKRSIDPIIHTKMAVGQADRKPKKQRKSIEKIGASVEDRQKRYEEIVVNRMDRQSKRRHQRKMQTEQFLKSMQMLQSNCKPDHSEPFEDYSIFLYRQIAPKFEDRVKGLEKQFIYVPDRENRLPPTQSKRETDEDFAARIKDMEQKWQEPIPIDKKPKDLLRAIGKIETSDWNIREIEKKIIENKMGKSVNKDKERVPKWSREQFSARLTKMEKQHLDRQNSAEVKYAEIDKNIKQLDLKLKEGSALDLNQQKVASIAEKLVGKTEPSPPPQPKTTIQKSNSRTMVVPPQGSEYCHFCSKRVYLMERLSAEGRFFHRGCFRCEYCHTLLRLGSYMFDKEGVHGFRFYCTQHFGMAGELRAAKVETKPAPQLLGSTEKQPISGVLGLDLLDRVQTPERVEFSNLSTGHISSDHESQIDEDEWTDRNFRNSVLDSDSSDDSSSASDTDSDDEAFEEALEEPVTKEGTMKWAERYKKKYSHKYHDDSYSDEYSSSDHFSYEENSSGDDDSDTATEGEEEIRARELRKQEVRVEPPVTDTGTDTEIASCESGSSSSSSAIQNSATEISTDSEFAHNDPTPTRDAPKKMFDQFVTMTRGSGNQPKKVQVKSGILQQPTNGRTQNKDIELKFTPLIPSPVLRKPPPTSLFPKNEGYALNRTQSTGGIATKVSLELKKKYLLGEQNTAGNIQKSGSASTLDSKFKSFHTNISDCQKLLKPAPEISASMQVFCNKLNERTSPLSPLFGGPSIFSKEKLSPSVEQSPVLSSKSIETPKIDVVKCVSASSVPEIIQKELFRTEDAKEETRIIKEEPKSSKEFVNETEGRPRSPIHEKSIIVPVIDWDKTKQKEKFIDSLSSSSSSESEEDPKLQSKTPQVINNIPRLEIHDDSGAILEHTEEVAFDSLNLEVNSPRSSIIDPPKSITSERKTLNQPKKLPTLPNDSILPELHSALHVKEKPNDKETQEDKELDNKSIKSGRSSPSINDDLGTAALTETELSDWARDGAVSDDLEDDDYEFSPVRRRSLHSNKLLPSFKDRKDIRKATIEEMDDVQHVCGKVEAKNQPVIKSVNILHTDIENIEFMDTGTESSDDNVETQNNGYVRFTNDEDFAEDSLSPVLIINSAIEATNPIIINILDDQTRISNREICDDAKNKLKLICDNEEDTSLLTVEAGTTTEENTCSDSTVKQVTEKLENKNEDKKTIDSPVDAITPTNVDNKHNPLEFEEHCQRLQSKVEFSNAKDSIDIRKSRRKSKPDVIQPDIIQEEKKISIVESPVKNPVTANNMYKREEIEKERNLNQKLVQEMVMNKMKAQNKSLERKKRNRNSFSPIRAFELTKSATTDIASQIKDPIQKPASPPKLQTPDVLLSVMPPLQKSQTTSSITPLEPPQKLLVATKTNIYKLPDISQIGDDVFKTPKAPPRLKNEEAKRTAEKLKQDARARMRLMSDEDLGLSPEDKLKNLRDRTPKKSREADLHVQDGIESLVINTERRNSLLYSNDTLKRNTSFRRSKSGDGVTKSNTDLTMKLCGKMAALDSRNNPLMRTKSVTEINRPLTVQTVNIVEKPSSNVAFCKSDPNLLCANKSGKKSKDRERRKSITKLLTEIFTKKKDPSTTSPTKGFLARISPKSKSKSKDKILEPALRRNSISEVNLRRTLDDTSPPPIPPLPANYTGHSTRDESSDGEHDGKRDLSSCDTLDQSGVHDDSLVSSRRSSRGSKKTARQAQLKRHRMAQEIQRKLEETEVKTRELEHRGVMVEKALRGEANAMVGDQSRDEADLLKEWFDLMRERTDIRRYEKELMIRAQELELEDRHARLQHELRDRLENNEPKSKEEMETEGCIIKEMMEIVAKRDSLISILEEDRLRYSEEDRDFEEQMLAKGINLTSLLKTNK